jgi:hypothetical protein
MLYCVAEHPNVVSMVPQQNYKFSFTSLRVFEDIVETKVVPNEHIPFHTDYVLQKVSPAHMRLFAEGNSELIPWCVNSRAEWL